MGIMLMDLLPFTADRKFLGGEGLKKPFQRNQKIYHAPS